MTQRRSRARIAAAASLLAFLAACGGSDDDSSGAGGDEPAGDAAPASFVYAAVGVPSGLDVWTTYEGDASRVNMYEWGSTLVQYDASGLPEEGCQNLATSADLRPNLAESWEYNEDRTQLIFTLREGVESPVGNVMTAEDVVWSLDRAKEQSSIVRFLIKDVARFAEDKPFEVVDERTVAVNLAEATALDAAVFTYPMLSPLDRQRIVAEAGAGDPLGNEWLKTNTATFGAFELSEFTPSTEVVYEPNPNFWDQDALGNINSLVIRSVPDAGTRLQLVESGEADYAERLSFDQYKQLEGSDGAQLLNCASPNRDTLLLNQAFEPFADVEVRQAVSAAINREALVEGVYKGFGNPATTGISNVYWEPGSDAKEFAFDPEAAQQLLESAGVQDLSFAIIASPTRPGAYAQSLAVQIQSMLGEVGIEASVEVIAGSTEFSDAFFKKNYQAMIYLEPPAIGDPFYSANLYNSTASFQNTFGYSNPDYDAAVSELLTTPDGEERSEVISTVSDLVVETVPQAYLVDLRYLHAFGAGVEGYENTPHGQLLTYRLTKR